MKALCAIACIFLVGNAEAFQQLKASESAGWVDQIKYDEAASAGPVEDIRAIQDLVSRYQIGVKQKDEKTLMSFYLNDSVPVISSLAPKTYAVIVAANPQQSIPRYQMSTAKVSVPQEVKGGLDTISNLVIRTDGAVGSASWNYVLAGGNGRGTIEYSVIRANDGWKIAGVLFSINVPAADKS